MPDFPFVIANSLQIGTAILSSSGNAVVLPPGSLVGSNSITSGSVNPMAIYDEGVLVTSNVTSLNFVGTTVTSNIDSGSNVTVTITGTTVQVENYTTLANSSGIVNHDFNAGGVFLHSSALANFTANFANVPTDNGRITNYTLIIPQGNIAYYPNVARVNGTVTNISWLDNVAPTPTANKTEIYNFTLLRFNSNFSVMGSLASFG